ncbi:hypothetical protein JI747_003875 [Chryseobacterium sp. RG1]|uniref:Lipoprotein n=1 Tax=Chryseobacterium tagetis TaxID=2801334 RepID=A0ABS7ZX46_9FLAO|nr:hypothetical protein [Chryseobacterium tagetis]MCA6066304.1 hypothetical protein [Chryseobacterium tagetis]
MKNILFIPILLFILVGCKDFKKSIDDTLDTASTAGNSQSENLPEGSNNNSFSTDTTLVTKESVNKLIPFTSQKEKLEKAEEQLRKLPQFAGKSIFIYEFIHFYDDGRIITTLQNPENPNYVDEYTYENEEWQDPKPVILSKSDDVKGGLVNLNKLPFHNANNIYKTLLEKRKEIGSDSDDYTIYAGTRGNKINWYPESIDNERSVYNIEYHEDGTLKSFEQK